MDGRCFSVTSEEEGSSSFDNERDVKQLTFFPPQTFCLYILCTIGGGGEYMYMDRELASGPT